MAFGNEFRSKWQSFTDIHEFSIHMQVKILEWDGTHKKTKQNVSFIKFTPKYEYIKYRVIEYI